MRKLGFTLIAATALTAAVPAIAPAAPLAADAGVRGALKDLNPITDAQFVWGGRRHCWYVEGWHGPGWYWCGYAWRRGLGWGGPEGYRGWEHRERMEHRRERLEERHERREDRRERREDHQEYGR